MVDSAAAGDAFVGGLAASLAGGDGLHKALRLANAAGALAVTRFGAQTSLPSLQEARALLSAQRSAK
jgi:ribokinase